MSQNNPGFIYVLQDLQHVNVFKVGMTTRDVHSRADELFSTSRFAGFEVVRYIYVKDAFSAERDLHTKLAIHRINDKREFFKCPIKAIDDKLCLIRTYVPLAELELRAKPVLSAVVEVPAKPGADVVPIICVGRRRSAVQRADEWLATLVSPSRGVS